MWCSSNGAAPFAIGHSGRARDSSTKEPVRPSGQPTPVGRRGLEAAVPISTRGYESDRAKLFHENDRNSTSRSMPDVGEQIRAHGPRRSGPPLLPVMNSGCRGAVSNLLSRRPCQRDARMVARSWSISRPAGDADPCLQRTEQVRARRVDHRRDRRRAGSRVRRVGDDHRGVREATHPDSRYKRSLIRCANVTS